MEALSLNELLNRQLRFKEVYPQCIDHAKLEITKRPSNCVLCHADQRRALEQVLEINKWLVQWQNDAIRIINKLK